MTFGQMMSKIKISKVQAIQIVLKVVSFISLVLICYYTLLENDIGAYTQPGTTKTFTTEIVSSYQSPAFTFCFTPPFNASSKLRFDFFIQQGAPEEAWHKEVPLWDLFMQSSYKIGVDFDVLVDEFTLKEGLNNLKDGRVVEVIPLPTFLQGMCHIVIPRFRFKIGLLSGLGFILKFYTSPADTPSITNIYITAPNDWSSVVSYGENALNFQLDTSRQYTHVFLLEETEYQALQGNEDCQYGCRPEQCKYSTFDQLTKYFSHCPKNCMPVNMRGLYKESYKQYARCQKWEDHRCFLLGYIAVGEMNHSDVIIKENCWTSKINLKYTGIHREVPKSGTLANNEIDMFFTFTKRERTKEQEEQFHTFLDLFVAIVGSLGTFIDLCFQTIIFYCIDLVTTKLCGTQN